MRNQEIKVCIFVLSLIMLIGFASSCLDIAKDSPDTPTEVSETEPNVGAGYVSVDAYKGYSDANTKLMKEAVLKANEVVASQCFYDFMKSRDLKETQGKSAIEVANFFRANTQVIDLQYYSKWRRITSVSAYTYPNIKQIYTNWSYFSIMNECEKASVITHETSHKSGFTHDYYQTTGREFTVPYSINAAFKVCCKGE